MADRKKKTGKDNDNSRRDYDKLNSSRSGNQRNADAAYHRGGNQRITELYDGKEQASSDIRGEELKYTILEGLGLDIRSIKARKEQKKKEKEKKKSSKKDGGERQKKNAWEDIRGLFSDEHEETYDVYDTKVSDINEYRRKPSKNAVKYRILNTAKLILYVICIGYLAYQIYFSFYAHVKTEMVMSVTFEDTVDVKSGYSIRDENIIRTDQSGVIISTVDSGGKVSKGEIVARVFNSLDAAQAYARIAEIDETLERFGDMSTAAEEDSTGISSSQKQLNDRLLQLSRYIYSGELKKADRMGDDILYLLNKQQLATGLEENFDTRVNELKTERSTLLNMYRESPASLLSPRSGYYISKVDGYENVLSTDILDTLTPDRLDELLTQKQINQTDWIVGKIADDYIWYIACEVKANDADFMEESKVYTIRLPYSDTESIKAKLKYINWDESGKNAVLVFECTYMVSELSEIRSQPMTIVLSSHTGLEIDRSCIVELSDEELADFTADKENSSLFENDEDAPERRIRGVYILWGNEVRLRLVEILYEQGDKVICRQIYDEGWLKLYDRVVTNTKGLYNGKIISGSGNNQ